MLKGIVSYLFLLVICGDVQSQQVSLFQHISTANGLPSNYVFDLTVDGKGFLWAGTDKGLAKFDGFRWELLTTENGLPGNYVGTVLKAGDDALWLGISTKGLYHFTISTGKTRFITKDFLHHYLQTDAAGNLFYYNSQTGNTLKGYEVRQDHPDNIQPVFQLTQQDSDKKLFVDFEKKEILFFTSDSAQINIPDPHLHSAKWKKVFIPSIIPTRGLLKKISPDCYSDMYALYYTLPGGQVKQIPLYDTSNNYLNAVRFQEETLVWDEKTGLCVVSDNGTVKKINEKDGLTNLLVSDVHITEHGNLIISSFGGGLYYLLPNGNAVIHTDDKPVKGISWQGDFIYAITQKKLLQYNLGSRSCKSFPVNESTVQAVDVWGDDIFISSLTGFSLQQVVGSKLIVKNEMKIGAGIANVILSNNKYYAGSYGNHVFEYDKRKNEKKEILNSPSVSEKLQSLSSGYASYNYEDGISFLSGTSLQHQLSIRDRLPSNDVYHVHERSDTIWISTGKGIGIFTKGKWAKSYTAADGISGGKCRYSFHDSSGRYYVVTDKYLNFFNGSTFSTIPSAAIIQDKYDNVTNCLYHPGTNSLVAGSLHNLFILRLENVAAATQSEMPELLSIKMNGSYISPSKDFTVPANNKSLVFQFRPVDTDPFSLSVIYYQLEGYQSGFTQLKDSLSLPFSTLRSGRYRLLAKAMNASGVMSDVKVLASFSVKPPFAQSLTFIILTSLLASGMLAIFVYYYQKRKRDQLLRQQQLEASLNNERERISKDLHDHLGTAIVTMIAQTDNIEARLMSNNQEGVLEKVKELSEQSRETVNVLRETIWAVQENSHSLEEFVLRTRSFLQRVLPQKNIEWDVTIRGQLENKLTANQSLQLFRVIQEATQNIVKHAAATKAAYSFIASGNNLQVKISDNGKGFDTSRPMTSNGLKNITTRMTEITGTVSIEVSDGTHITLTLPVMHPDKL